MTEHHGWTPGETAAKDPHSDPDHDRPWWQGAVFYQIYPRSFQDTPVQEWSAERRAAFRLSYPSRELDDAGGDGVGDLDGIRRRLPHLAGLGVDAIWLSPFFRSPMADFGYDVSDHCDVDPLFGTLGQFDRLVAEAHEHGLRVIIDFVPNHTSVAHPWFADARSSRHARHRDWYIWRDPVRPPGPDGDPGPPPNNWTATFVDGPAWTWDASTGQWYLHLFLPDQPDLNWENPEVIEAMHRVMRFWLDRDVDGFRVDVIHGLGKDPALPDDPPELVGIPHSALNDDPRTHPIIRDLRRLVDSFPGDRVIVGEVFLLSTALVAPYYGEGDELHLAFNFPPLYAPWEADAWRTRIDRTAAELDPRGAWPTWVLSNHDNARHRTRYGGGADRARAAALLLLGLRGTPFVYAGEELGLSDAVVPPQRAVDPGGRDGCRAPIPWEPGPSHGWASDEPWLPWPPEADGADAATQEDDPGSFLQLYRHSLSVRRGSPALRLGAFRWLASPPGVLLWERTHRGERTVVAVNFTDDPADLSGHLHGDWRVAVASDSPARPGTRFAGTLGPVAALWLQPA